jgi:hypothetical protein
MKSSIEKNLESEKKEIQKIFKTSPEAIIKLILMAPVLGLFAKLIGGNLKKYLDYYAKLLFNFTKDHPIQSSLLAAGIARLLCSKDAKEQPDVLSMLITAGVGLSILSYRNEMQLKSIKKVVSSYWKVKNERDYYKIGTILTSDGKTFYEVSGRLDSAPKFLVQFTIKSDGTFKYSNKQIELGAKISADRDRSKELFDFVKDNKMYDVTDCMMPGAGSKKALKY